MFYMVQLKNGTKFAANFEQKTLGRLNFHEKLQEGRGYKASAPAELVAIEARKVIQEQSSTMALGELTVHYVDLGEISTISPCTSIPKGHETYNGYDCFEVRDL